MKTELSFRLTGTHPYPEYAHFNFDDEVITVSDDRFSNDRAKWYWSSKLGCSQGYDTPEHAVKETCRRHGVTVLKLEKI
jgi:hypothetical protein